MFPLATIKGLPEYHENLLLVRVRSSAAALAAALPATMMLGAPGFAALATLERAGLIKQVTPLAVAPPPRPVGVAVALASAATPGDGDNPLAGTSVIELEEGVDSKQVRMTLATDPH